MKSGLMFVGFFLLGVIFASFMISAEEYYLGSVHVEKGWNLIHGMVNPSSQILPENLTADNVRKIYMLLPITNEYLEIYPGSNLKKFESYYQELLSRGYTENDIKNLGIGVAIWVYFDKSGSFGYSVDTQKTTPRKLYSGWNFVGITKNMFDSYDSQNTKYFILKEYMEKNGCNILQAYSYNVGETIKGDWKKIESNERIFVSDNGKGIAIEILGNCALPGVAVGECSINADCPKRVTDNYCNNGTRWITKFDYICATDIGGVCVSNNQTRESYADESCIGIGGCTDTDVTDKYLDGINYYQQGIVVSKIIHSDQKRPKAGVTSTDRCDILETCNQNCGEDGVCGNEDDKNICEKKEVLFESYCREDGNDWRVNYECPNGCQNGVCLP